MANGPRADQVCSITVSAHFKLHPKSDTLSRVTSYDMEGRKIITRPPSRTVNLRHLLRECPLTRAARNLILPAATPLHDLCIRHEVSVLKFLVSADLVPGPETLYVVPRASAAAVPTVLVAAAVAAAITDPVSEAGVTTRV